MYAVIFKAEINELDNEYFVTAKNMRERAQKEYGCIEFCSSSEKEYEIAVSYWETLEQIKAWSSDLSHREAQLEGKRRWYKSYTVEITEVIRQYGSNT